MYDRLIPVLAHIAHIPGEIVMSVICLCLFLVCLVLFCNVLPVFCHLSSLSSVIGLFDDLSLNSPLLTFRLFPGLARFPCNLPSSFG